MRCSVCGDQELSKDAELATTVCEWCTNTIAAVPMTPSTRPPTPCGKCNGFSFTRVIPREMGSKGGHAAAPMFATYQPTIVKGVILPNAVEKLEAKNGYGMLELFICQGCGFVEWYCPTVADIPIEKKLNTEHVDYRSKDGPHR